MNVHILQKRKDFSSHTIYRYCTVVDIHGDCVLIKQQDGKEFTFNLKNLYKISLCEVQK